jgi:hypothetical protein
MILALQALRKCDVVKSIQKMTKGGSFYVAGYDTNGFKISASVYSDLQSAGLVNPGCRLDAPRLELTTVGLRIVTLLELGVDVTKITKSMRKMLLRMYAQPPGTVKPDYRYVIPDVLIDESKPDRRLLPKMERIGLVRCIGPEVGGVAYELTEAGKYEASFLVPADGKFPMGFFRR